MKCMLVVLALLVSGCASTEIVGYTDPDFKSVTYRSTVVYARNIGLASAASLEGEICDGLAAKGVDCRTFQSMFPPTRRHSADLVFRKLQSDGVDSLIVLDPGGSHSSSSTFGYQSIGSASVIGNTVSGGSTTVPMTAFSRQSSMRVILVDTKTRNTAWIGDAKTEGQGLVNTTDSAFMSSLSKEVARALLKSPNF